MNWVSFDLFIPQVRRTQMTVAHEAMTVTSRARVVPSTGGRRSWRITREGPGSNTHWLTSLGGLNLAWARQPSIAMRFNPGDNHLIKLCLAHARGGLPLISEREERDLLP